MRPTIEETMLAVAEVLSRRATCRKLAVGCVLTDMWGKILGTGYNGVPKGLAHCTDTACSGASAPKGADLCEAVHAEQNALLVCSDVTRIYACYTTHAPCMRCTKLLLNTGCRCIRFLYVDQQEEAAKQLWEGASREWRPFSQLESQISLF